MMAVTDTIRDRTEKCWSKLIVGGIRLTPDGRGTKESRPDMYYFHSISCLVAQLPYAKFDQSVESV